MPDPNIGSISAGETILTSNTFTNSTGDGIRATIARSIEERLVTVGDEWRRRPARPVRSSGNYNITGTVIDWEPVPHRIALNILSGNTYYRVYLTSETRITGGDRLVQGDSVTVWFTNYAIATRIHVPSSIDCEARGFVVNTIIMLEDIREDLQELVGNRKMAATTRERLQNIFERVDAVLNVEIRSTRQSLDLPIQPDPVVAAAANSNSSVGYGQALMYTSEPDETIRADTSAYLVGNDTSEYLVGNDGRLYERQARADILRLSMRIVDNNTWIMPSVRLHDVLHVGRCYRVEIVQHVEDSINGTAVLRESGELVISGCDVGFDGVFNAQIAIVRYLNDEFYIKIYVL